jgi:tripartite-type tricarboxylate transporter receptor subunit TctC
MQFAGARELVQDRGRHRANWRGRADRAAVEIAMRGWIAAVLSAMTTGTTAPAWEAPAQDYPARAVKIIVPFAAGGPADVYARFVGQHLQDALEQSFVVENWPGAGAVIGTDAVAKSAADGYALLTMSNTHTTNESLLASRPYPLMRDFVAVAPINASDLVMVVHPSVEARRLGEFIAKWADVVRITGAKAQ